MNDDHPNTLEKQTIQNLKSSTSLSSGEFNELDKIASIEKNHHNRQKNSGLIGRILGKKTSEDSLRDAIEDLIEENIEETGYENFSHQEQKLIVNILGLHDLRAIDVMMPRADIIAFPIEKPLKDLVKLMVDNGLSRVPIYKKTLDDIVGIVHVKDILGKLISNKKTPIAEILNPKITFISPAMRVLDLLREMQIKRVHMAMVVDEYGGIDGLITIEDLVEQIVGEIEDEHDAIDKPKIIKKSDGSIEADARSELEDFEEIAGKILTEEEREDEDIDTIGGLITQIAGRIPARGEVITHSSGTQFRIIDVDPRTIKRLAVFNLPNNEQSLSDISNNALNEIIDIKK
ncbi:MAG: hemolysin family protein [Alphaproteobacteria bacterium]